MTSGLSQEQLTFLARAYPPWPAARSLLQQAGFGSRLEFVHQSAVGDPIAFWYQFNADLEEGAFPDAAERIRVVVHRKYRANPLWLPGGHATPRRPRPDVWYPLFIGASPTGAAPIRADEELLEITNAMDRPPWSRTAAQAADLSLVRALQPHILHLCCHCRDSTLIFNDASGAPFDLHAEDEAAALKRYADDGGPRLHGIVVNACTSDETARILSPHADVVIAHRDELRDGDGIAFAGAFYKLLVGDSRPTLDVAARTAARELVRARKVHDTLADGLVVYVDGVQVTDVRGH
ncbi:hypothetical protein ACFO1B_40075 [Dactylosporangium siamense]|uniref:CHAT domain-containing protein n=1 Tax=Dactylosporangium siamense TaxID=685454 RepID=A0A919UC58_9ACTN|nr:hypothetical protein [Dactylosporangium siamense]GIG49992.1 hypothetical protein Dsi01nite_080330 [Dactylosporangium siamense]